MNTSGTVGSKTLCVVPLAFLIFTRFLALFLRSSLTFMIPTSKTPVKTQENCKKNVRKIQKASPTRENVSILHYAMGKNASQLRFGCALVMFWLGFGHVLVAF